MENTEKDTSDTGPVVTEETSTEIEFYKVLVQFVDVMVSRGAVQGSELQAVANIRQRLVELVPQEK